MPLDYADLLRALWQAGFTRVERDDRLLDVFVGEDREKGVELWEHWGREEVAILRLRIPYDPATLVLFKLYRSVVERALQRNEVRALDDFENLAEGEAVRDYL